MESGGAFLVLDARTGEAVGSTRFYEPRTGQRDRDWLDISGPLALGRRLEPRDEAKQLLANHALQFVRTVLFRVGPQNMHSQRAMEKIGGIRSGLHPDVRGEENVLFKITRASFAQTSARST
jgi:N-acetyltransferase